jgi:hypothetical protein
VAQRFCSHTQDLCLVAQRLPFAGVMELILGKKFEGAISFHIDRVSEVAIVFWEHSNNDAAFMAVDRSIDPVANRKLRHRKLPRESSMRSSHGFPKARLTLQNSQPLPAAICALRVFERMPVRVIF